MKIKYYKLKINELVIILASIFIVASGFLSKKISFFSYSDDILMIIVIIIGIYRLIVKRQISILKKEEQIILALLIVLSLIAFIGNYISKFQTSIFAILIDFIGWQKFFLAYLVFLIIIKPDNTTKYRYISFRIAKITIVISLILEIVNVIGVINLAPGYERFGIHSFNLGGHPSSASAIMATIACLFMSERKKNFIWVFLSLLLCFLTFRFKAIGFTLFSLYCIFFMKEKTSLVRILLIASIILIIVWPQINFYFLNSNASRIMALKASTEIAKDFFPIGSGYATFGTKTSGMYYSLAYDIYGLSSRWGFMRNNYSFIGDGGIANILAQFGVLGSIFYIVIMILLIKSIKKRCLENNLLILPFICFIGYLLISITNEGGLNSENVILIALMMAILIKENKVNLTTNKTNE